jgi:hypothetical protein
VPLHTSTGLKNLNHIVFSPIKIFFWQPFLTSGFLAKLFVGSIYMKTSLMERKFMSYKNWELINESMGHNLGLSNRHNLGAVGSKFKGMEPPPLTDDEEDEEDEDFGDEDVLGDEEGDMLDDEDFDDSGFPPKSAGEELLGDEMGGEDEFGGGDDYEMGDLGDDMDYDSSEILQIDPDVIDGLDDEGMEGEDMGLGDEDLGIEGEDLDLDMGDEALDDDDMDEYMHDMKRAHMGYLRKKMHKMMMRHEATIAQIKNEKPLNEVAPLAAAAAPAIASAVAPAVVDKLMMKKAGGKSTDKKGKKNMSNEHFETHEEFLNSLSRGAHNELGSKYDSGFSEDALFPVDDPNSNFEDEPKAGSVGFAPQGRVGAIGGGGYTMDDVASIPTLGESTENEFNEWMQLTFGESEVIGENKGEECPKASKKVVKKEHVNETTDFLNSLAKNAKRSRGGW